MDNQKDVEIFLARRAYFEEYASWHYRHDQHLGSIVEQHTLFGRLNGMEFQVQLLLNDFLDEDANFRPEKGIDFLNGYWGDRYRGGERMEKNEAMKIYNIYIATAIEIESERFIKEMEEAKKESERFIEKTRIMWSHLFW